MKEIKKFTLNVLILCVFSACSSFDDGMPVRRLTKCDQQVFPDYVISPSFCTSDTCATYTAIWKKLFLERNKLSEEYFDTHVVPLQSNVSSWNDGMSFSMCYEVRVGWAIAYSCDQFVFNVNNKAALYPALPLPRNVNLTIDDIRSILDKNAFGSSFTSVSGDENLKFGSQAEAMAALIGQTNVNTLCFTGVALIDGKLTLTASASYVNEFNSCIHATMNLPDGVSAHQDGVCFYSL